MSLKYHFIGFLTLICTTFYAQSVDLPDQKSKALLKHIEEKLAEDGYKFCYFVAPFSTEMTMRTRPYEEYALVSIIKDEKAKDNFFLLKVDDEWKRYEAGQMNCSDIGFEYWFYSFYVNTFKTDRSVLITNVALTSNELYAKNRAFENAKIFWFKKQ